MQIRNQWVTPVRVTLLLCWSGLMLQRAQAEVPVVFVPGTGGTAILTDSDEYIWLDSESLRVGRWKLASLDSGQSTVLGGILDTVKLTPLADIEEKLEPYLGETTIQLGLPVYHDFLRWGQEMYGSAWYTVPYDWRLGACPANSHRIDAVVTRAMRDNQSSQVILVAHSLGGLVSREYAMTLGRGKVAQIIAAGTPWLGTPKSARALLFGYDFGVGGTVPNEAPSPELNRVWEMVPKLQYELKGGSRNGERIVSPTYLTLLDPTETKKISISCPSVYQMLPSREFHELYAEASGVDEKSVLYAASDEAAQAALRSVEPNKYDTASTWRSRVLNGDSGGVHYTIIAATCQPDVLFDSRQVMQYARNENRGPLSGFTQADLTNNLALTLREYLYHTFLSGQSGVPVFLSELLITERGVEWGDGTVPLLSASAGAAKTSGHALESGRAQAFLGEQTQVEIVRLGSGFDHVGMLNDPQVRDIMERLIGRP